MVWLVSPGYQRVWYRGYDTDMQEVLDRVTAQLKDTRNVLFVNTALFTAPEPEALVFCEVGC